MEKSAQDFSWLDELNPEQRRAVTHGAGPLLVVVDFRLPLGGSVVRDGKLALVPIAPQPQ